ncbi:MAG TPA: glycerol-3-phosphate dehydrogenase [Pyrinomonadaceae bacterium]
MSQTTYSQAKTPDYDVIIIGAGINGAGVARDAAIRGLKVLLLDKGDICGGTSAWSTRLIHGGLRYLEHGEVGLVRESLREREVLLRIAPHLVRPLPVLVPIYANQRRGPLTIHTGMLVYDLLSWDKSLPRHRFLSLADASTRVPGLKAEGLLAAALYYDTQVEFAERLVLENVLSAVQHSAHVRTYTRVDGLLWKNGQVEGVTFSDRFGDRHAASSQVVVNAAGPWIDEVLKRSGFNSQPPLIGGTKGSHLIVAPFPGAPADAIYLEAEQDHRPVFIIPWIGNYLIGTTDIRYTDSPDHVEIDHWEIEYLLAEVNRLIPSARLTTDSILFSYSGVRPLAYARSKSEEGITRRHFIREHHGVKGLMSLVGGKLTTYRILAEHTVDLCYRRLRCKAPRCTTATMKLPGAVSSDLESFRLSLKNKDPLSEQSVDRLLRIYGSRAADVLRFAQGSADLFEIFDSETSAIAAEVVFAFKAEMATTLSDCLLRRTMVGLNSTRGLEAINSAGRIAEKHLGWPPSRAREEVETYRRHAAQTI